MKLCLENKVSSVLRNLEQNIIELKIIEPYIDKEMQKQYNLLLETSNELEANIKQLFK